jgi:hypothetical protein
MIWFIIGFGLLAAVIIAALVASWYYFSGKSENDSEVDNESEISLENIDVNTPTLYSFKLFCAEKKNKRSVLDLKKK